MSDIRKATLLIVAALAIAFSVILISKGCQPAEVQQARGAPTSQIIVVHGFSIEEEAFTEDYRKAVEILLGIM